VTRAERIEALLRDPAATEGEREACRGALSRLVPEGELFNEHMGGSALSGPRPERGTEPWDYATGAWA